MAQIITVFAHLRNDRRGMSFLEFVSTICVIAGVMMVAGTTFDIDPRHIVGSMRASIIGWGR